LAVQGDDTDGAIALEHGHREQRAHAPDVDGEDPDGISRAVGLVGNVHGVDRNALARRFACRPLALDG
jgi:hypothetical protein